MTLTFAYILIYLSMKRRFNDLFLFLASIPLIAVCFASITPLIVAGTAASALNTFNYVSQLEKLVSVVELTMLILETSSS